MAEAIAHAVLWALASYAGLGLAFALAFAAFGAQRIDANARGATLGFRALVVPGATALWPVLLRRWLAGRGAAPTEANAHRRAAR